MSKPSTPQQEKPLFAVSTEKLMIMSVATFGLYDIYWFYRQFRAVYGPKSTFYLFVCALFSPLTAFSLFGKIAIPYATLLAVAYLALNLSRRLPEPFSLLVIFTFVPLIVVQRTINAQSKTEPSSTYSKKEIAFGVIGGLLLLWSVLNTLTY